MKDRGTGAGGRPHTESPESPRSGMRKPGARLHADGEAVRWRARGRLTGRRTCWPAAGGGRGCRQGSADGDQGPQGTDSRKAREEKHTAEEGAGQAPDATRDSPLIAPGTRHRDGSDAHALQLQGATLPSQRGTEIRVQGHSLQTFHAAKPEAHPQPTARGSGKTTRPQTAAPGNPNLGRTADKMKCVQWDAFEKYRNV